MTAKREGDASPQEGDAGARGREAESPTHAAGPPAPRAIDPGEEPPPFDVETDPRDALPVSREELRAYLGRRDTLVRMLARAAKSVAQQDVQEVVNDVCANLLASDALPPNHGAMPAWVEGAVAKHIATRIRKRKRRAKYEAPLETPEDAIADERQPDDEETVAELETQRAWMEKELANHPEDAELYEVLYKGGRELTYAEAAVMLGISKAAVQKRANRLREKYAELRRKYVLRVGILATLILLVAAVALAYVIRRLTEPPPEQAPPPPPTATASAPLSTPLDVAELRQKALDACDAKRWDECVEGLNRARDLDPAGDRSDPRVQEARDAAAKALLQRDKDKGGAPPKR